ncbi:TPA: hypothetical protein ACH3X3_001234 [Trebouxia sp. C0006]
MVAIAGDSNAKEGNLPDAWVSTFSEDIPAGQSQDQGTNALGPHLMQLCEDTSMVLCTGRTPLDTPATPSYPRGNSRLDHTLVSPSLFPFIHSWGISSPTQDSDHCPRVMKLHLLPAPLHASIHAFHTQHSPRHTCDQVDLGLHQAASLRQQVAVPGRMRSISTAQHPLILNASAQPS